jgi:hypothetical protein
VGALQGVRLREGRGSGVWAARNGQGGAGAASACIVGAKSTTCARMVGEDRTDRQGPQVSGRERASERAAPTGGTRLAERERATCAQARETTPIGRVQMAEGDGTRGGGGEWVAWAKRPGKGGSRASFYFFIPNFLIPFSFIFFFLIQTQ